MANDRLFALVGNPNTGKTTLFNGLTGLRQKVANYPGVTVEKKEGEGRDRYGNSFRVIDLPGAYSLRANSPDEQVTHDVLVGQRADTPRPDCVICVVDASNPERHLFLATQVLELGLPVIIVLNKIDEAAAHGIAVAAGKLEERLGVPVVPMQADERVGMEQLQVAMSREEWPASKWHDIDEGEGAVKRRYRKINTLPSTASSA